jgi:RHS repeat-associated protein
VETIFATINLKRQVPLETRRGRKKNYTAPTSLDNSGNQLFNGNISFTTLALSKINSGATTGYSYGYDQLNRLVEMRQHKTNAGSGWSNSDIITAYRESIAYDANGNILKYLRHGDATTTDMDSLSYKYTRDDDGNLVNNKLNYVKDNVSSSNYSVDIDDQSANNYDYDLIGNLKKDASENIDTIRWTVYGKINKIVKNSGGVNINYGYDAGGNRTTKIVSGSADTTTFYVRDAQGNVLAIYTKKGTDDLHWSEQDLYGSSRLGLWRWDTIVPTAPPVVDEDPIYDSLLLGSRTYELTNHLGNVLATISDKKIGNDSDVVNYYIAEVLSQNDYYPFGMMQPARTFRGGPGSYRYGFNGKENDDEVKGEGNQQDYGMRIYDPRLGRFLSVDPLNHEYPWYSAYEFSGNTPIQSIDLDGAEPKGYSLNTPSAYGSRVKFISSQYDNQAWQVRINGGKQRLMNVYAIQDIDTRTYLIFETATGAKKEQWYYEYDKNGYKGDVNSFTWSTPPDPTNALYAMTLGPLVGLPAAAEFGFGYATSAAFSSYVSKKSGDAAIELAGQLIGNGFNFNKVDWADVAANYLPIKGKLGEVLKEAFERTIDITGEDGLKTTYNGSKGLTQSAIEQLSSSTLDLVFGKFNKQLEKALAVKGIPKDKISKYALQWVKAEKETIKVALTTAASDLAQKKIGQTVEQHKK